MPAYRRTPKSHWRFRKQIRLPDGTKKRIYGKPMVNTKKAAEAAERLEIEKYLDPSTAERRRKERHAENKSVPTLSEYRSKFIDASEAKDKQSNTKAKKQILNAYLVPRFGDTPLDEITQHTVDVFIKDLASGKSAKNGKPLARKTINNITSVLGSLMKYAKLNRELVGVPGLQLFLETEDNELWALPPEDLDAMLRACVSNHKGMRSAGLRYQVALLLANDCGMRVGEVRGLDWSAVNFERNTIQVRQAFDTDNNLGPPKTWHRRILPMSKRLARRIGELHLQKGRPASGFVITHLTSEKNLGYSSVREKLLAIYKVAGVERPSQPWHCMRHAFCTSLAHAGVEAATIQKLAGHKSVDTTMGYIHVNEAQMRDAISATFDTSWCRRGAEPAQQRENPR